MAGHNKLRGRVLSHFRHTYQGRPVCPPWGTNSSYALRTHADLPFVEKEKQPGCGDSACQKGALGWKVRNFGEAVPLYGASTLVVIYTNNYVMILYGHVSVR